MTEPTPEGAGQQPSPPPLPPSADVPPPPPDQPPAPSYDQPPAPSFDQPPAPSFDQPPAPSFDQPPAPSFDQPPAPSFDQPPAPGQPAWGPPGTPDASAPPDYPGQPGYPPPPYGAYPPAQPTQTGTDTLAIIALVVAIVFACFPVAGLILGIIALTRTGKGKRGGRGLALAATIISALLLLAGIVFGVATFLANQDAERDEAGNITETTKISVSDLRVGDCFTGTFGEATKEVNDVTVVPCTQPHQSQVADTFDLEDGDYPGEAAVTDLADKGCSSRVTEEDLTAEALERDDASLAYLAPTEDDWDSSREVSCIVTTDAEVTVSLLK